MTLSPTGKIDVAGAHGIVWPTKVWVASQQFHVPYFIACSFLEQETGGGHNIFGHDPGWYYGAGVVTEEKYRAYKAGRAQHNAQGVGPLQLTSPGFQDAADAIGGCWQPLYNLLTGFHILDGLFTTYKTWWWAAYHWNGSGQQATQYANEVTARFPGWFKLFNP